MRIRKEIPKGNVLPKRLQPKTWHCVNCGHDGPSDTFFSYAGGGKYVFCTRQCSSEFWDYQDMIEDELWTRCIREGLSYE